MRASCSPDFATWIPLWRVGQVGSTVFSIENSLGRRLQIDCPSVDA